MVALVLVALASSTLALSNATRQFVKEGKVRGVIGTITMTNPNLDAGGSGLGVFNRVAVTPQITAGSAPANAFLEIGWVYDRYYGPASYSLVYSYKFTTSSVVTVHVGNIVQQTSDFSVLWDYGAGGGRWTMFFNGYPQVSFTSVQTGFDIANAAVAGSEALIGVESLNYPWFSNL
ncbi:MAG: hypothetical protein IPM16_19535 [Chloroflexi bacterium]|nr:hypothetical protein [Chloroflexota bacterium]